MSMELVSTELVSMELVSMELVHFGIPMDRALLFGLVKDGILAGAVLGTGDIGPQNLGCLLRTVDIEYDDMAYFEMDGSSDRSPKYLVTTKAVWSATPTCERGMVLRGHADALDRLLGYNMRKDGPTTCLEIRYPNLNLGGWTPMLQLETTDDDAAEKVVCACTNYIDTSAALIEDKRRRDDTQLVMYKTEYRTVKRFI